MKSFLLLCIIDISGIFFCILPLIYIPTNSVTIFKTSVNDSFRILFLIGLVLSCHQCNQFLYSYLKLKNKLSRSDWNIASYGIMLLSMLLISIILFGATYSKRRHWLEMSMTSISLFLTISTALDLSLDGVYFEGRTRWHLVFAILFGMSEGFLTISYHSGLLISELTATLCSSALSAACLLLFLTAIYRRNSKIMFELYSTGSSSDNEVGSSLINCIKCAIVIVLLAKTFTGIIRCISPSSWSLLMAIILRYVMTLVLMYIMTWLPHIETIEAYAAVLGTIHGKNCYVSYTAHEIRSPLQSISLGLDLALEDMRLKGSRVDIKGIEEIIDQVKISADLASSSLNDFLLFDKIQSHAMTIELQPIKVWMFMNDTMKPFYIQARAAGVNLVLVMHEKFDGQATFCMIDPLKMQLVVRNLISNALKFSSQGHVVKIVLELTTEFSKSVHMDDVLSINDFPQNHRVVRIAIIDQGPGISKAHQSKLFKLFSQIDAGKLQGGRGSGVGLWLSKNIVCAHNGVIGMESEGEGLGSCFYIELASHQYEDHVMSMNDSTESPTHDYIATPRILKSPLPTSYDVPKIWPMSSKANNNASRNSSVMSIEVGMMSRGVSNNDAGRMKRLSSTASAASGGVGHLFFNAPEDSLSNTARYTSPHAGDKMYNILVVDDVLLVRKMVQRALAEMSSNILLASNGHEAIEIIRMKGIHYFDIILVDGYMPQMDGFDTCLVVREAGYLGLIFGVTGSLSEEDKIRFQASGADEVLYKPISLISLRQSIKGMSLTYDKS